VQKDFYNLEKEENLIEKTCRKLNINQKELAEKIGFSVTSVSNWRNGKKQISKNVIKTLEILSDCEDLKIEYELFRKSILIKN
jgi:transcriptional regulator with XRE-family HTH domain